MKVDWDKLRRLHEAATAGEWLVFAEGKLTDLHIAGNNSPIVHWIGFDGSDRPRTHNRANAKAIAALHNAFPAILAEREAAQRFINHVEGEVACYLGSGDDGVIGDANVLRAVTIMHKRKMAADNFYRRIKEISDSGDCGKMLEDAIAAFDKEQQ